MNFMQRLGASIMAGATAFNQTFTFSGEQNAATFESLSARNMRYQMGWAWYEGTIYNNIQAFAQGYKNQKGLYRYVQSIYNPTSRIGNFYKGVVWRGSLDAAAGDSGAIPITVGELANDEQLRAAIAHVWKISNWNINKNVHVLNGTILGDCALYIRDDIERKQSRIEILHPSTLSKVEVDTRGFVKAYIIEESRVDERGMKSTYKETAEHGTGDEIIFRTYKNNVPYAWDGNNDAAGNPRAEWTEPYGFIPLVLTQHITEGRDWGKSEVFNYWDKFAVIDDEATLLHDQIRKTVNPFKLANFKRGNDLAATTPTATADKSQPGKEKDDIIYVDMENARITPIVTALDIVGVSANIKQMLDSLENDLPELSNDIATSNIATDTLLAKRARVESKVIERRINYDTGMIAADQMAIAIGGFRGYEGYRGFDLDSYGSGKLDHSISDRPVFPESENEKMEKKIKIWQVAADMVQKTQGQIPAEVVLLDLGMSKETLGMNEEDEAPNLPTARMNAIKAQQEDTIPQDGL
jgi:hypothetical protein